MPKDNFQQNPGDETIKDIKPQIPLPEDNDPPFSPPDDASKDPAVDMHQQTDTGIDEHEMYDAGKETASHQMHHRNVEEGRDGTLTDSDVEEKY